MMGHTLTDTQCAAGTLLSDVRQVSLRVKGQGLVAGVIADHVILSTVDTHVLVNESHHLMHDVQRSPCSSTRQGPPYHILYNKENFFM